MLNWLKTKIFWFLIDTLIRLEVKDMKKPSRIAVVFAWLIVEGDWTIKDFQDPFKAEVKQALVKIGYPELAEEKGE